MPCDIPFAEKDKHARSLCGGRPDARAMAEWMFDSGRGHVDEPRFELCHVAFYPSDFTPEQKDRLQDKILRARFHAAISPGTAGKYKIFSFDAFPDHRTDLDREKCAHIPEDMLSAMQDGYIPFFKNDTPAREGLLRENDRRYFVRAMEQGSPDVLEYLIRSDIPIHLNSHYEDDLDHTFIKDMPDPGSGQPIKQYGSASFGLLESADQKMPYNVRIAVGAASILPPHFVAHILCHEAAHSIVLGDPKIALSPGENERFDSAIWVMHRANSSYTLVPDMRIWADVDLKRNSLIEMLYPSSYSVYSTYGACKAEVFCDMLGLSFGEFAGEDGAERLREHYRDYPRFAEAVIHLRDTVRAIFDERLQALRETTALPKILTRKGAEAGRM